MNMEDTPPAGEHTDAEDLSVVGHPKGTLAVLILYMLLFIIGWAGLYFFTFLPRGTPDTDVSSPPAVHAHEGDSAP